MCKEHIIGYIRDDKLILDMLCIFDDQIEIIAQKINSLKPMIEILDKKDGPTSIFIADWFFNIMLKYIFSRYFL